MTPDLAPIEAFIASHHPFSELPPESLRELAHAVQILYRTAGDHGDFLDPDKPRLYIIRKGAIELKSSDGKLIDRLGPGASFGFPYLLTGEISGNQIIATEDILVYAVPASTFHALRHRHPAFERYFTQALAARFRLRNDDSAYRAVQRISEVMTRQLVAIDADAAIKDAAILMTEKRVSSVLVTEGERLVGIVTDRDLRARVLAVSGDPGEAISTIMTVQPVSATSDMFVHEAGLLMLQHNVHHLPVLDGERPIGVMSASDLLRVRNTDPLYLVSKIAKSKTLKELKAHASQTQRLLFELIRADLTAENIAQIFTGINDALTRRLIELAQGDLGEAPADFCWLSFGSQARMEQHAGSDQDNALVYLPAGPEADIESTKAYFLKLATFVCQGLDQCGFPLCLGDIMAKNPKWCLSVDQWVQAFDGWIEQPSRKGLMHSSIFYDIRGIAGDTHLSRRLQSQVLARARKRDIFLALMTKNALSRKTPLGFFKQFAVTRSGQNEATLDLKHFGLSLITDIARVYALSAALPETATPARLRACAAAGVLNQDDANNLLDAFEFICHLRLRNQLDQLEAGQQPDNMLDPKVLSSLQRNHLKAVFRLIDRAQRGLEQRFSRGLV
ncbi:MAG: cyclic nucleotide-binding protein [unclassified Hahellaceae]|nr:cyclic nucleotide-binding protein [Hahellaceae bacterium]|tara:strand:- start:45719 stop:47572 length:1854 start_codon:yes stop_codon:yes gene_type:complete